MSRLLSITLLGIASLAILFSACNKEPEIIVETVTITDTLTLVQVDTVTIVEVETIIETILDTATTYILVRHAETMGGGTNPVLSPAGEARAMELAEMLGQIPLQAVFSTNYNRTLQTAQPCADDQGLSPIIYDPFSMDQFVDDTLEEYKEGTILVVGHSNTTADLINTLIGSNVYPDFPEDAYDNFFVVNVFEKGRASVVHLKYGE